MMSSVETIPTVIIAGWAQTEESLARFAATFPWEITSVYSLLRCERPQDQPPDAPSIYTRARSRPLGWEVEQRDPGRLVHGRHDSPRNGNSLSRVGAAVDPHQHFGEILLGPRLPSRRQPGCVAGHDSKTSPRSAGNAGTILRPGLFEQRLRGAKSRRPAAVVAIGRGMPGPRTTVSPLCRSPVAACRCVRAGVDRAWWEGPGHFLACRSMAARRHIRQRATASG